jgi:FtsH-binding integral membrane protein
MSQSLAFTPQSERRFFSGMAIFLTLIVFVGFSPSFYLRGIVHFPRPNPEMSPLMWFHGAVFTTWMILVVVQTQLVALGRRDIHKKLGIFGLGLAGSLVPLIYFSTAGQVAKGTQPPIYSPETWSALPLFGIIMFVPLILMGAHFRQEPAAHKRFMIIAAATMAEPALGRIFPPFPPLIYAGSFAAWLMLVPLMLWDIKSIGHLHWATKTGAVIWAITSITRYSVWQTQGWQNVAGWLVG